MGNFLLILLALIIGSVVSLFYTCWVLTTCDEPHFRHIILTVLKARKTSQEAHDRLRKDNHNEK